MWDCIKKPFIYKAYMYLTKGVLICYNTFMKIKTIKNLIILGTIVFSFGIAGNSSAYSCSGYECDYNSSYGYRSVGSGYDAENYDDSNSNINERTIVNNYYYGTPSSVNKNSTSNSSDSVKNTGNDSSSDNLNTDSEDLGILNDSDVKSNLLGASAASGLTALSLRGSGGFMPSSIWQWILAGILLLVIIILIRVLINNSNKKSSHH